MSTNISLSPAALSWITPSASEKTNDAEMVTNEVDTALTKGGAEKLYKQAADNLLKLNVRLVETRQILADASSPLKTRVQEFNEKIAANQLHSHVVAASLQGLAALIPGNESQLKSMASSFFTNSMSELQDVAKGAPGLPPAPPAPPAPATHSGSNDFFSDLLEMIKFIREGYLGIYENLITQYSAFFKEFNEEIMSKMGDWITGANDGKDVTIGAGLLAALNALISKYSAAPQGVLFPPPGSESKTREEALKWAQALGLDPGSVVSDGRGGFVVMMDLSALQAMRDSLPASLPVTWDSAKFQAWQTGFNSQESELKNQLQIFTTKYGNANSYYENFNKILSSQLSQYAEMLKAYLAGLGG